MVRIKQARPSPALVVAILALMVAIGGTAYAVSKVGGKDLKPFVVKAKALTLKAGESKRARRNCGQGERYISGGWDATAANAPPPTLSISTSGPNLGKGNPKGFNFIATNAGADKAFISVYTVCLTK